MTASGRWRYAASSVIGTSHVRSNTPCQDSHAVRVVLDANRNPTLVIAVSDGAGSAVHAEVGSSLTCATLMDNVEAFLSAGNVVEEVTRGIAEEWVAAVHEVVADAAGASGSTTRDYACTMLLAVIAHSSALFLQIGDGALVVSDGSSGWQTVFWPDRGEYANTTYFVTDEAAKQRLMFKAMSGTIEDVAVFSDGIEPLVLHYASKSAHAPFFERMIKPLRSTDAVGPVEVLCADLSTYLSSPTITDRTDDDKTLVLASRVLIGSPEASQV